MIDEEDAIAAGGGWAMSDAAERAVDALDAEFPARYAGSFFTGDGTLVVLVKELAPVEAVEVTARLQLQDARVVLRGAPYSELDLDGFAEVLDDNDAVSAIAVDVQRSQLVLHTNRPLGTSELTELLGAVPADAVRVEHGEVYATFHAGSWNA